MTSFVRHFRAALYLMWTVLFDSYRMRLLGGAVVLRSNPKSGTNYLRMLLTNYVCNLDAFVNDVDAEFSRISYTEMKDRVFPNDRGRIAYRVHQYIRPDLERAKTFAAKYTDFMYDHGCIMDKYKLTRPCKLILLYRNPLDTIISRYHYAWKSRLGFEDQYSHPREVVEEVLSGFVKNYKLMKDVASREDESRVLLLSYEDMYQDPVNALAKIIQFLGLPLFDDLVKLSVDASSINEVRNEEKRIGQAIHAPECGLKGSFARSGKIGQWKQYFTSEDVSKVREILSANGIGLEDFVLDSEV